jgi:hypothetical protein
MVAYVLTGMVTGIIGGMLTDAFKLDKWVDPYVSNAWATLGDKKTSGLTIRERLHQAWLETRDVLGRVWLWVLIGVGIGAAIHGYVPQQWFIDHAGADNLFAVPLAVIMAVPLYSNVTGTVPIAEVLIAKGLPVGTTLALIMSTVAISLPELMILRKVLLPKMLIFFVAYLATAFILVGYGFNMLF